ncbi:hypothetical protein [Nocardioides sp.]|uniref:hypothetical protein n=1 Tax=Nocardioides sp. TaxID=35761 RepID=UPI00351521E9
MDTARRPTAPLEGVGAVSPVPEVPGAAQTGIGHDIGTPSRASRWDSVSGRDTIVEWEIELDRLELDVLRAEHALASGTPVRTDTWQPRHDLGPLPAPVVPRARDLLARQVECLAEMARQLGRTAQQQVLTTAVSRATERVATPVYVDLPL